MAKTKKRAGKRIQKDYKQSITYKQKTREQMQDFMDEMHTDKVSFVVRHCVALAHENHFNKKKIKTILD